MGQSTKASTIANDLLIVGNISSSGAIRLEGRVRGDVQCASLVLGENSQLEGCAIAEDVVVWDQVGPSDLRSKPARM
jgi:cytoskeletal protein CcmA (bactofilin family)